MMMENWDDEAYALLSKVAQIETIKAQTAYLDEACAGNQALRQRVERLLRVYQQAGSFLDEPAIPASEATANEPRNDTIGAQIGAYKILQEIGEGGFGVVYMAEQQRPVRRKVALKIIKPGMDSREVIARFEAEQQALAMMDHPNIARVLDAGTTDNGRPYFAMELVKGVPITEYCDKNNMSLSQRLDLFVTVCRAIQHAHQKGVIHRDLKPSNIMVTLHDGKPVPKVIDFGVAKAISQQLTERTIFTQYGQMIGTPQYMSPEQAEMSGLEVDTRSDIYSLGVLLYEMLTGTTPLTAEQLRSTGLAEIKRVICEEEPPTPSTRLSTLGDRLTIIASHRQSDAGKLRQLLHGELDWIVMKSLDKDRSRRYETASALANDIEAYLNDEPVQARPPSVGYLLGKAVRRHRVLAITSAIVALILVAATVISAWQAIHAYQQSQLANEAKQAANANLGRAKANAELARIEADKAKAERQKAERLRAESDRLKDEFSRKHYASDMDLASQAYADGRMVVVNEKLEKQLPELRGFDWYHWWLAGHLHHDMIFDVHPFWDLTVSPNGTMAAASAWPGIVKLFRTKDAVLVGELPGSKGPVSFSPDGRFVATAAFLSGHTVKVWGASAASLVRTLDSGHRDDISATAFSPASSRPIFAAGDNGGRIMLWDASTWRLVSTIDHRIDDRLRAVRGLAFASGGNVVVAGTDSGEVIAYDVASCKQVCVLEHTARITTVVSTPRADLFAASAEDGSIQLWNEECWTAALTQSAKSERVKQPAPIASLSAPAPIVSMAFSADGQGLAVGTRGQNSVLIWKLNSASPELSARIQGHVEVVTGVAFVGDSDTLWSASQDGSIRIWDLDRCEPFDTLDNFKSADGSRLAYSTDGRTLMVTRDGDEVRRWDIAERVWRPRWRDGERYTRTAVSADGSVLAGVARGVLHVWDLRDPEYAHISCSLQSLDSSINGRGPPLALSRYESAVRRNEFFVAQVVPGNEWYNNSVAVIDARTGKVRRRIPPGTDLLSRRAEPWSVFSPDGSRLAVRRFDRCEIWDIDVDPPVLQRSLQGFGHLRGAAFSPDGRAMAIAGAAQNIGLYEIATGTQTELSGHTGFVTCLAFSQDGAFFISGGEDGAVCMWDTATGQLRSTFTGHQASVTSVAVSPTGESIASRGGDGTIRIWKAATTEEVNQNVDAVLARAEAIGSSQNWDGVISSLDQLIKIHETIQDSPHTWKLFAKRGDLLRRQRHWTDAIEDYNRAIKLRPSDGVLHMRLAEARLRVGKRSQAIEDFVTAIRLSPLLSSKEYLDRIRNSFAVGDEIVPEAGPWRYTTAEPPEGWEKEEFDDSGWPTGRAPFGLETSFLDMFSGRTSNSLWRDDDIWLRCAFTSEAAGDEPLVLNAYVNDTAEIFLNGVPAAQIQAPNTQRWWKGVVDVASQAKLKPGMNVLAVHCQNRDPYGSGKIDVGLYLREDKDSAFESVLSSALRQSPDRPALLCASLADLCVQRRQWSKAADCFDQLTELSPRDKLVWLRAATLHAYNGRLDRYREICGDLCTQFDRTDDHSNLLDLSKACLISPPVEADLPAIVDIADRALTAEPSPWRGFRVFALQIKALAEYRRGNDQAAIEWAEKCIVESQRFAGSPHQPTVGALALAVMAMAQARLGERESAIEKTAEFSQILQQRSPLHTGADFIGDWQDWLICEILHREMTQAKANHVSHR